MSEKIWIVSVYYRTGVFKETRYFDNCQDAQNFVDFLFDNYRERYFVRAGFEKI